MSKKKITRPNRDPDNYSKRGVPYWWAPEWTRGTAADVVRTPEEVRVARNRGWHIDSDWVVATNGDYIKPTENYGRIHAVKESNGDVNLYMKSKEGNLSYIQGSIQREFKKWHLDREIDYILLGLDPEEIIKNET